MFKKNIHKNPVFYFGLGCLVLFGGLYFALDSSANMAGTDPGRIIFSNSLAGQPSGSSVSNLFSSKAKTIALETPDFKLMGDNTLCGVATPCVVSGKVLGDAFGGNQTQKEVIDYVVQPGDTVQSVADANLISANTLIWANDISKSATLKAGRSLAILPIDGVLHVVKSGDTMLAIASKYKAPSGDIISYNNLANQDDIYIGDILIIPGGTMPKTAPPVNNNQIPLASNYFIYPTEGIIWQGLHYYNAVDIANKCGTPIYAAAAGVVQRAVGNGQYNQGAGNHITILHGNGTVTYYGHLMTLFVKPGESVTVGQRIALMGGQPGMAGAGKSTGCHVHFQVTGAKNWLASFPIKTVLSYK